MDIVYVLIVGFIGGFISGVALMRSAKKYKKKGKIDSPHNEYYNEK